MVKIFDTQQGWDTHPGAGSIYVGHGEWHNLTAERKEDRRGMLPLFSDIARGWLSSTDYDIWLHDKVWERGYPNRWGAMIPVKSTWNLELMESLLNGYEDQEVVEWLRYGWPSGRLPTMADPVWSNKNHKGAADHPEALEKYITKELGKQAIMGPYPKIPFKGRVGISPLSTTEKKNSLDRRVILDLSFPEEGAVNDGMIKDTYLGFPATLTFPKVDDLALRIYHIGTKARMFKIDLSRYFRQLPLDPGDYSLIGYMIGDKFYFDKVLPMGMRTAPYIAQRVTNAIAYIHRSMSYFLLNYVDDFVGAEAKERILEAYNFLSNLLKQLRVETSPEKMVAPTHRLEFLGVTLDAKTQTMEVSQDRLVDIVALTHSWLYKTKVNRKELESLIGKLQFIAKCVKPGRTFIARLINWLKTMDKKGYYGIPLEARKDIAWWGRFLETYNGVSLIWLTNKPITDMVIATDASSVGFGGTFGNEYFRGRFPKELQGSNIAVLELLAVMVALKIWGEQLQGMYFWVHVDNEAVSTILNTGASRHIGLQDILREVAYIAATNQFVIRARHIMGITNRIPDWLSRWQEPGARKQFRHYAQNGSLKQIKITNAILNLDNKW